MLGNRFGQLFLDALHIYKSPIPSRIYSSERKGTSSLALIAGLTSLIPSLVPGMSGYCIPYRR